MTYEIEGTYENGALKLDQPLPLHDQQRVKIIVQEKISRARQAYGLMGWTGDAKTIEQVALDPELDVLESP